MFFSRWCPFLIQLPLILEASSPVIHHLVANVTRRSMGCKCGIAEKGGQDGGDAAASEAARDQKERIVNGYEPRYRPWMTFVQHRTENGELKVCIR